MKTFKTIEMVRDIREKQHEKIKGKNFEEVRNYFKNKSLKT